MKYPSMVSLRRQHISTDLFRVGEQFIGQPKLDGIFFRLNIHTLTGNTKDDKEYDVSDIFEKLHLKLKKIASLSKITHLLGELVYIDPVTKNITRNRSKVMDVLLKHQHYETYLPHIKFVIFDLEYAPDIELFNTSYYEIIQNFQDTFHLPIVTTVTFSYHEEAINNLYNTFNNFNELTNGEPLEGVVVKRINSQHFQFRNKPTAIHLDWYKVKNVHTATLRIVAIKAHSKDPNLIGSFIVTDADNILRASIGSGLTKEIRHMPRFELMDKVIEIEYEAFIVKTNSFVHPRFKLFREDDKVDNYEKIRGV